MDRIYVVKLSYYVCGIIVLLSAEGSYGTTSTTSTSTTSTSTTLTPTTPTTTPSSDSNPRTTDAGANSKRLALFIFLPIFLFCYCGACVLYCMHKIIKHCIRRKPGKRPSCDVQLIAPLDTPTPTPAPMQAKIPAIPPSSRPFSAGERAAIYPTPPPPHVGVAEPPRTARDSSSLVTYQHTSTQSIKKDPMTIFEDDDEPVTARNVRVVEDPPPMYTDKREERRARLLGNAARESRERQKKAAEEGRLTSRPFTIPKRQAPEALLEADEEAPAQGNAGFSTNLISQAESPRDAATPTQNAAEMPISDILRMKMAQQAKQKGPRKSLAT